MGSIPKDGQFTIDVNTSQIVHSVDGGRDGYSCTSEHLFVTEWVQGFRSLSTRSPKLGSKQMGSSVSNKVR